MRTAGIGSRTSSFTATLATGHVVGKPAERVQLSADVTMNQKLDQEGELFSRLSVSRWRNSLRSRKFTRTEVLKKFRVDGPRSRSRGAVRPAPRLPVAIERGQSR